MNIFASFLRVFSGNRVANAHLKDAVKALLIDAVDRDDDAGIEQAITIYQELRSNERALPGSAQAPVELQVETNSAEFTDDQALRKVTTHVMFACHKQGFINISTYDLFDKVNHEMARQGGWTPRDLETVPFRASRGTDRLYWRENLSRVLSAMKADGELANPTAINNRTYCLGPQLLRQLLPAREQSTLPPSIDVATLHTVPLDEDEGLAGWQAIN